MPGVGPLTIKRLWARWPDLAELFEASVVQLQKAGLSSRLAKTIATDDALGVEDDWRFAESKACHLLTWADANYPEMLKQIPDSPPVLYAKGQLSCLSTPALAVVGTRQPTSSGREIARRFARELAAHGLVIVSGLARGIDGEVHQGVLAACGRTIAVMGTGIDCIYPPQHATLAEAIVEKGLLLTEFPLKSPPIAGHFPRRNRIISGLSLGTLVIEAALKSGSLLTARLAMEQNRDVFAIPGSLHNEQAQGCHDLVRQGAMLVTSVHDVIQEIQVQCYDKAGVADISTSSASQGLLTYWGEDRMTVDQLIARSGLGLDDVIRELTELELMGFIHSTPGGYMRCIP